MGFLSLVRLAAVVLITAMSFATTANAQLGGFQTDAKNLKLDKNSPFRDPDVIYLEADELESDQIGERLIARGQVEGRYQDKTLRADRVNYNIKTGQVIAIGNVQLINANGSSQYADKLELSDTLEAGTATNFTARFPEGGFLGSAFAARNTKNGVELYNAYYTACEPCRKKGEVQKPTWRLKARRVTQNAKSKSIQYRDAVFEFKGIPLFYTPYLAHPDPSVGRASGFLMPFGGISGSKGVNIRAPYFFALSPSSELTLTPHVYSKVNPLLRAEYAKKFHTGRIDLDGSLTHSSFFTSDGDFFDNNTVFSTPEESLNSNKWRSHLFATGQFDLDDTWTWGFQGGYATDDNYLSRYDLEEYQPAFGLYQADNRRLIQQAFLIGQGDNFRYSASSFGQVSLRTSVFENPLRGVDGQIIYDATTGAAFSDPNNLRVIREDDSALPVVAPKIEVSQYFKDPVLGGRIKLSGDATILTRQNVNASSTEVASRYLRTTGAVDWHTNWIAPAGVSVKPFAGARMDYFDIKVKDTDTVDFTRTTGQVGVDLRWPLLKTTETANWIIEPRAQLTQNFGNGKTDQFTYLKNDQTLVNLAQDAQDTDLDETLLWATNKSTGFDYWQKGFRADIGASFGTEFGDNSANLFLGKSFYEGSDDLFTINSGLMGDSSDLVGQFDMNLGSKFTTTTRLRYDDSNDVLRRIDSRLRYQDKRFGANVRYFKLNSANAQTPTLTSAPNEELSGTVSYKMFDNWTTKYSINRDLDQDLTRRQALSLVFDDDCTRLEFMYTQRDNGLGLVGQSSGFGIRVSLLTLGDFSPQ